MRVIGGGIRGRVIMVVAGDGGVGDWACSGRIWHVGDGAGGGYAAIRLHEGYRDLVLFCQLNP